MTWELRLGLAFAGGLMILIGTVGLTVAGFVAFVLISQ